MTERYAILTPIATRARYATLTDRLITVLEGRDGWRPDEVVYLDKSGRRFAAGRIPPLPGTRIANIDREQWWDVTGGTETGLVDVGRVPIESIEALRSVFIERRPRAGEPVGEVPAWLDGKRVLVVDEVSSSGDTLRIARGLLARAFPTADVRGDHWMTPARVTDQHGLTRVGDMPVWYRSDTWTGRLVGNRFDPVNPPITWRGHSGAAFLSTRSRVPDIAGRRLRQEAGRLAADVAAGRLLAAPSSLRDTDDWVDRVQELYGFDDPRAFTRARVEQDGLLDGGVG